MCQHPSPCPPPYATDCQAARVIACHPEQGWSLLCNGVIVFDDTGALLPDGTVIEACHISGGQNTCCAPPGQARQHGRPRTVRMRL
jgi:Family of unknown function (DUF5999)